MTDTNENRRAQLARLAKPALAVVVLIQALGLFLSTARDGTPVGSWLFLDHLWSDPASRQAGWAGAIAMGLGTLLVVFARKPLLRYVGGGVASAWSLALALAEWNNGGAAFSHLAVAAHAARIAAPLALALWDRKGAVNWVLRVSIASTFAIHGWEALHLHPRFIDLVLAADRNVFGLGLTQHGAGVALRVIGLHDIALAIYVLGFSGKFVLRGMAIWGFVTAFSRVVQGGDDYLHLTIVRVANGGLPLVLLLLLSQRMFMTRDTLRLGTRFARVALPALLFALPLAASAQAIDGGGPGHLRLVWTEDPAHRTTVSWSTASAGSTHEVLLDTQPRGGDVGAYAQKVAAASNGEYATGGGFYHHAELTGLAPSTTYYFVVVSDGQASPERHFVTAPVDDRPFRILAGGDSRAPGEAERRIMNGVMAGLVDADPEILALAHGGDYIQSDDAWEEWESWMTDHALTFTESGRVLPIIPVRGNHEGDGVMYNQVFGFPGGQEVDYFATRLGPNAVLLNLDTNSAIGGEQATWLEEQLKTAQAGRWILASYHDPAYPAYRSPSGALEFWVPLFEQYNADVVLESDGHVLKRTLPIRDGQHDPTGVVYVGEGGLGVPQRTPNLDWYLEAPGMAASAHHVQIFSFSPGELKYKAHGIDGATEDEYTFQPRRTGVAVEPGPTPEEPGREEPGTEEPVLEPVTVASVLARSADEVEVTFSVDMDPATTAVATAYTLSPAGEIQAVELESPRTAVLSTAGLEAGAEYALVVSGVTSAEGAALAGLATATFRVPEEGAEPEPGTVVNPESPATPGPDGKPETSASGCSATGGAFAWAGLFAAAAAASRLRRRRR